MRRGQVSVCVGVFTALASLRVAWAVSGVARWSPEDSSVGLVGLGDADECWSPELRRTN